MINVSKWFFLNILRKKGHNFPAELLSLIDVVFAQYLENEWTEFNQILYAYYHGQDLRSDCKVSFFAYLQQLWPLIYVSNWFLLNILRQNGQKLTKFCIRIILDKIYVWIVGCHFSQIATELRLLIDVRIWFLLNILRMNGHNFTNVEVCMNRILNAGDRGGCLSCT